MLRSIFGAIQNHAEYLEKPKMLGASGWRGGYKRIPPTGYHKQLPRTEMDALIRKMR